ncbi:hypothetical protein N7532_000322 [Penicillium argentinense]|uniref:Uncharacterized protein n=1 Tax=Penicillium argentinense TaxID=1131581 RepID=A0A9W9KNR1_9EURO|nr:uncharacterized protein N7532_000322 [Penicillium argentinense]KAJ5112277.1 hypothetical protein N7532_000322 [Penicillium argentinense]
MFLPDGIYQQHSSVSFARKGPAPKDDTHPQMGDHEDPPKLKIDKGFNGDSSQKQKTDASTFYEYGVKDLFSPVVFHLSAFGILWSRF